MGGNAMGGAPITGVCLIWGRYQTHSIRARVSRRGVEEGSERLV